MNLLSILLTGSLITGGLGANALGMTNHHPTAGQPIDTVKTISELKAKEIALGETKGGIAAKSKIEEDNGMKKYVITIIKPNAEFTVEINATTGKVLNFEQEIKDKDEAALQGASPTISLENAKKTALGKIKGKITEAELDHEDKQLAYEVEILTADHHEVEVTVNAANGKVLSIEGDDKGKQE
jgi:uncharacterized membrane protein YkoI